jgi:hypothetical protein
MFAFGGDVVEMLNKQDNLHSDLVGCIETGGRMTVLRHPLVFSVPYHEMMNGLINQQYEYKRSALAEAKAERNWFKYVMLHERPYRLDAFLSIAGECEEQDPEMFWKLVASIYTDSENIYQNINEWTNLFNCGVERKPEWLMDDDELGTFYCISECKRVPLYRGYNIQGSAKGLSWTLSYEQAVWFAKRFGAAGATVVSALIPPKDILMYKNSRNEQEFVLKKVPDFSGLIHEFKSLSQ